MLLLNTISHEELHWRSGLGYWELVKQKLEMAVDWLHFEKRPNSIAGYAIKWNPLSSTNTWHRTSLEKDCIHLEKT